MQSHADADKNGFFAAAAFRGMPWMILVKGLLFFVYFAISVFTVRLLGREKYGVFSLCRNMAEYGAVVCGLGLIPALGRFVPELRVHHNRAGLVRLLWKSSVLQAAAVLTAVLLLYAGRPLLQRWFAIAFGPALLLIGLLIGAQNLKENVAVVEISLFRIRRAAFLSLAQGLLWLLLVTVGLHWRPTVPMALTAQLLSYGLVYAWGAVALARYIRRLKWRSPPFGIGKRRTLKYSGTVLMNGMVRMLMLKYTEVFFLGVTAAPAVVGVYDLGYTLPALVIFFIPSAIQSLFTSSFTDAYVRDPDCLPRLIRSFYRMLILMTVPLAAFGVFFSSRGVVLVYGSEMAAAGPVAAAFCVVHLLPMISMPLSMAIKAREQILNMLPLLLLQIGVNLVLDVVLILGLRLGMLGGILAVSGTFLLTIPLRLRKVHSLIGGIYFPVGFALRMVVMCTALAAALSPLAPHLNLAALVGVSLVYLAACLGLIRLLRLVRPADVSDFRALDIPMLHRILDILSR